MPRYLAIVLASAVAVMLAGFYLMAPGLGPYDMNAAEKKSAAMEASLDAKDEKPGLFAMFVSTLQSELETARKQQLGEYLPKTPEGWKIQKTNHDEIVAFTMDYQLELDINDKSSLRRLSGWGGANMRPTADVKFVKGDKVIFLRLTHRKQTRVDPMNPKLARLLIGAPNEIQPLVLGGLNWTRALYPEERVLNAWASAGHDTAMGVLTNASIDDVEALLSGMDVHAFATLRGRTKDGKPVNAGNQWDGALASADPAKPMDVPDQGRNFVEGVGRDEDEPEPQGAQKSKPVNLLDALKARAGKEDEARVNRAKSGQGSSNGSFQRRAGTFGSNCSQGNGAKFCSTSK